MNQRMEEQTNERTNGRTNRRTDRRTDGQAIKHAKRTVKINEWVYDEWGFRLHLLIYRLNWVRRTWEW